MKSLRVCIVIPAYNEGSVIGDVVKDIKTQLKAKKYSADVVVVNDGSKDDTAEQARKGGAKVIDHILNSGAGAATATGLSYANQKGYDIAATMDADGQHNAEDVLRGIKEIQSQGADLLIGSRLIDASAKDMSPLKRVGNWGLSFITMLLFGVYTSDSQSGLRLYSRKALEQLRWKTSGYEFCSEMIWRANQLKLSIGEFPITVIYTDYSKAKGQNNWNGVNILKSLVRRRLVEIFE
ncbi:MAG: glycosyltransferase family 2 protein [Candidatus Saccharimonas sp.]